ncbi:hypothetical protein ANSO36C_16090 [Nostoc cf. commune SO-36]|uniref:Uncharacterized protein n=1 Tax=Nostoc cf. commune SO-36 TaxID=449208 RepID=A0ABM7YYP6_NOSCO|nr:hypothetical protein [Nostoc commune]BDI15807.1 hypothetical protein ANSO36C_16090 [Nostoc cf. commune SO-36]
MALTIQDKLEIQMEAVACQEIFTQAQTEQVSLVWWEHPNFANLPIRTSHCEWSEAE